MQFSASLSAFVCTITMSSLLQAAPLTIEHTQGKVTLPQQPNKVLVLDINALDIADALGAEPAGVPGSNLPSYLGKYANRKYIKLGTLFEPDYEAINAAEADLAIVGGRSRPKYRDVSAILPTVDLSVDQNNFIDSIRSNVTTLGSIFDKKEKAAELVKTLDQKLDELKEVAQNAGTALILVTNAGKVGAYGPTSRVGWLHKEIGFKAVEENIDDRFHGGDVISFEYILEKNPDWLFVIDRDAATATGTSRPGYSAQTVLNNALLAKTKAVRNGHVVYLDPQSAYIVSSGYTSLTTLIDQVQKAVTSAK